MEASLATWIGQPSLTRLRLPLRSAKIEHDMRLPVPKNRRPKFECRLKILDLNNVPLVSGTSYIKWHLPSSVSAEHRGHTPKATIKDHKVAWDYEKTLLLRLTVDKNGMLQESDIHFEVLQEYSAGARGERIILGHIKLNLAEYVDSDAEGEEGITRRYLMQESKINSTLKISITMKQTEGERNFFTPSLKSAPVFGGIAGIMSTEQTEQDDIGHLPTVNSKTRENGEMQDMYRRTLASSWAVQAGELPADECVESIFAGGSGWREARQGHAHRHDDDESGSTSEATSTSRRSSAHTHRRQKSSGSGSTVKTRASSNIGSGSTARNSITQRSGRSDDAESGSSTSGHVQGKKSAHKRGVGHGQGDVREVDEFDVREDLRSWRLPEMN